LQRAWSEAAVMKAVVEGSQTGTERVVFADSEELALLTEADEVAAQLENCGDDIFGWVALGGTLDRVWSDCCTERREKSGSDIRKHCR
jgi:hypothetical protein